MAHVHTHDGQATESVHYSANGSADHENGAANHPTHAEIAQRAHQLWLEQGCPQGTAAQNWFDAERELRGLGQRVEEESEVSAA